MSYYNVILQRYHDPIREEKLAGGTVTPGHLVKKNSSDAIVVHSTAAGHVKPLQVAIEDELQGKDISDNYSSGDLIQTEILLPGDKFYGILTTSQTIVIGDLLESAGNGTLRKMELASTDDPQLPIARAEEAKTTTGSVARIICRAV